MQFLSHISRTINTYNGEFLIGCIVNDVHRLKSLHINPDVKNKLHEIHNLLGVIIYAKHFANSAAYVQ